MSKSKRRAARGGAVEKPSRAGGRVRWVKVAVVAPLALCVLAAGAASLRWQPVRRAVGLAPLAEPQASPTPLALAKEYVYAGGRLVATEEPAPSSGPPPTNLVATATTATSVDVTWAAPAGAVGGYVVERAQSKDGPYVQVGTTPASQTSFTDAAPVDSQPPTGDTAYLYRVKATYAGGGYSAYSDNDLATTVIFTDDPLVGSEDAHPPAATVIQARHLTELRRAVSAVHALAGLNPVTSWTYPDPVSSPASSRRPVYLKDVKELRDRLDEALPALGRTPPAYAALTQYVTKVQAAHFQQLRNAVK